MKIPLPENTMVPKSTVALDLSPLMVVLLSLLGHQLPQVSTVSVRCHIAVQQPLPTEIL